MVGWRCSGTSSRSRASWRSAFSAVYRRVLPDLPFEPWARPAVDVYEGMLAPIVEGIAGTGAFGPVERSRFDWEHEYGTREWLDQVPTHGGLNQFEPERIEALLTGLGTAIDAAGGRFTMPYATLVLTAPRAAARAARG